MTDLTMTTTPPDAREVAQADIDAARAFWRGRIVHLQGGGKSSWEEADTAPIEQNALVQAFRDHRLDSAGVVEERLRALERDSHPPVDLEPFIREIIAKELPAALSTAEPVAGDARDEALEKAAKLAENWNGTTRDGDTLHIAEAIRDLKTKTSAPTAEGEVS